MNKTQPYDVAEYLESGEDMAAYLDAAMEDGDPRIIANALGSIARAKGMTQVAKDAGLSRESLYKALSGEGNPEFSTIMKVLKALGLTIHAGTAKPAAKPRKRRQAGETVAA